MTETVPVKLVCTMSSAAAGSCSARAWSPSTPNATSTRSKSPKRSNVAAHERLVRREVGGVERDGVDRGRARGAQLGRGGVAGLGLAGREHDPRARVGSTSLRTVAIAMSEVPPSTSTDCTSPSASFIGSILSPPGRR